MTDGVAGEPRVFRASGGRLLLGLFGVGAFAIFIDVVVRADLGTLLLIAPWVLLILWGVYVVAVASCIRADLSGVQVQNILRRTFVPWSRVERIVMRWQITLHLDDGKALTCFGGPSRSRPGRLGADRQRESPAPEADVVAALRRLRGESGAAHPEAAGDVSIRHSWDMPALLSLVCLVIWAVVAVLVAYVV